MKIEKALGLPRTKEQYLRNLSKIARKFVKTTAMIKTAAIYNQLAKKRVVTLW